MKAKTLLYFGQKRSLWLVCMGILTCLGWLLISQSLHDPKGVLFWLGFFLISTGTVLVLLCIPHLLPKYSKWSLIFLIAFGFGCRWIYLLFFTEHPTLLSIPLGLFGESMSIPYPLYLLLDRALISYYGYPLTLILEALITVLFLSWKMESTHRYRVLVGYLWNPVLILYYVEWYSFLIAACILFCSYYLFKHRHLWLASILVGFTTWFSYMFIPLILFLLPRLRAAFFIPLVISILPFALEEYQLMWVYYLIEQQWVSKTIYYITSGDFLSWNDATKPIALIAFLIAFAWTWSKGTTMLRDIWLIALFVLLTIYPTHFFEMVYFLILIGIFQHLRLIMILSFVVVIFHFGIFLQSPIPMFMVELVGLVSLVTLLILMIATVVTKRKSDRLEPGVYTKTF